MEPLLKSVTQLQLQSYNYNTGMMNATQALHAQVNWSGGLGCAELGIGKGDPGIMEKLISW